jgi:hypothetical protein
VVLVFVLTSHLGQAVWASVVYSVETVAQCVLVLRGTQLNTWLFLHEVQELLEISILGLMTVQTLIDVLGGLVLEN